MRTFLFSVAVFAYCISFGQSADLPYSIPLNKTIISVNESEQNLDMGMGMVMVMSTKSTNEVVAIGLNGNVYTITKKLVSFKTTMDMMGQKQTYDSDLKSDNESDMGKQMQKFLFKTDTFSYNITTNKATLLSAPFSEEGEDAGSMSNIFLNAGVQPDEANLDDIIFSGAGNKKGGDQWTDTSSTPQTKTSKSYVLKTTGKEAVIDFKTSQLLNTEIDAQGMTMNMVMDTKTEGSFTVNSESALVLSRNASSTIDGKIEVMGQESPISGTVTSTTRNEFK